MNHEEEERLIFERREVLYEIAVDKLKEAASAVEEFGYEVVCTLRPVKKR